MLFTASELRFQVAMTRRVVEPFMGIGCQELMADGCSHSGMVEKESQKLGLKIGKDQDDFPYFT